MAKIKKKLEKKNAIFESMPNLNKMDGWMDIIKKFIAHTHTDSRMRELNE